MEAGPGHLPGGHLHLHLVTTGHYPLSTDGVQGDGGGPLLCPSPASPATFTQAAITAWGIGCGGPSPGVYAALAEAVCWIDM